MSLLAWHCIPYNRSPILWCWHYPCALQVWPVQCIYLKFSMSVKHCKISFINYVEKMWKLISALRTGLSCTASPL
jgi:hypothetical protein